MACWEDSLVSSLEDWSEDWSEGESALVSLGWAIHLQLKHKTIYVLDCYDTIQTIHTRHEEMERYDHAVGGGSPRNAKSSTSSYEPPGQELTTPLYRNATRTAWTLPPDGMVYCVVTLCDKQQQQEHQKQKSTYESLLNTQQQFTSQVHATNT